MHNDVLIVRHEMQAKAGGIVRLDRPEQAEVGQGKRCHPVTYGNKTTMHQDYAGVLMDARGPAGSAQNRGTARSAIKEGLHPVL
jgi:hypothetical protein